VPPRVSVVMPARDALPHVGGAIASVLAQTFADLELVVVDDGSADATRAVAEAFARDDDRVRVISGPGRGVAAARNAGVSAARAGLVAFCDADDILLPPHVGALVDVAGRDSDSDSVIVTANAYWLFDGGIDVRKTRHRGRFPAVAQQRMAILQQNFVSTMSLFPRSLVDRVGPFATDLTHAEDWHFWMRAVFAGVRVRHQPLPLALYRWGTGLSADVAAMDAAVDEVLRRALTNLVLRDDERAYVEHRLSQPSPQALTRRADEALRAGRWHDARDAYRAAAALVPGESPLVWKSRLLSPAPALAGPLLRRQLLAADRRRGTEHGHQR
jgi:glycosyltransferase involved in cell wall biosynthesis